MIASLPMYDHPALRAQTDRYWQAIRDTLGAGPATLDRSNDIWALWQSPDLLLSQTCGFPYRARLHDQVSLVGTPNFGLPDTPPGHYYSVVIARKSGPATWNEAKNLRLAYNEAMSQSGWAAIADDVGNGPRIRTGSHLASALAVAQGQADFAAIDAQTYRLLSRYEDATQHLVIIHKTAPTPCLPYITSRGRDPAPIARAITTAIAQLSAKDRAALGLCALTQIPVTAYLSLPIPAAPTPFDDRSLA